MMGMLYVFREKGLLAFSQKIRPETATSGLAFFNTFVTRHSMGLYQPSQIIPENETKTDSPHYARKVN